MTFKHHFRNISIRIVVRDHHLKSEHRESIFCIDKKLDLLIININEPEDALLVRALSDEENAEPEERGVG